MDSSSAEQGLVIYRYPGADSVCFLQGKVLKSNSIPHFSGFVFAPFQVGYGFPVLILQGSSVEVLKGRVADSLAGISIPSQWLSEGVTSTSYSDYRDSFERFHSFMKQGKAQKIILSKIVAFEGNLGNRLFSVFDALCERYPGAFVYLFASGSSGVWMGATPELLLKSSGSRVNTVALAGTKAADSDTIWRPKEMEEHRFVSDFISDVIRSHGIEDLEINGPVTVKAGAVAHLQTSFAFSVDDGFDIWKLAQRLHPTPAVSGFPQKEAIGFIASNEPHSRGYYSGYLGTSGGEGIDLYVNLRCMRITRSGAILYVGGGLTVDSDVDEEWLETEMKSKTLLSVLENIV